MHCFGINGRPLALDVLVIGEHNLGRLSSCQGACMTRAQAARGISGPVWFFVVSSALPGAAEQSAAKILGVALATEQGEGE